MFSSLSHIQREIFPIIKINGVEMSCGAGWLGLLYKGVGYGIVFSAYLYAFFG